MIFTPDPNKDGGINNLVTDKDYTDFKLSIDWKISEGGNSGNIWLNGQNIVSFPVQGAEWEAMISKSKSNGWSGFGAYKTGKIGLQDHGHSVSFRNIKIKEL